MLGKKSGLGSISLKLDDLGLEATDEQRAELLRLIKQQGTEERQLVNDDAFRALYDVVVRER